MQPMRPGRVAPLALLVLAIVWLHGLVLGGFGRALPPRPVAPPPLQVRTVLAVPWPAAAPEPAHTPPPLAVIVPVAADVLPVVRRDKPPPARRVRPAAARVPAADTLLAQAVPEPAAMPADAAQDAVQLPPAFTLNYDVHRGPLHGTAELRWLPNGGSYELSFDARVGGFSLLRQASSGESSAAGLAPRRYTEQRAGREVRATNFQREAGKITFSGPTTEFPLGPGTQDRLSWMVQLAGVVAADARHREPGAEVVMAVVGTRADLATWVFRCVGVEFVDTPVGARPAIKFTRAPQAAHDTEVEVWLDPAQQHLPMRALLHNGPDDTLELLLRP